MSQLSSALCFVLVAACSDNASGPGRVGDAVDAPPLVVDGAAPAADAPLPAPDAPIPSPDAPCPTCACVPAQLTVHVAPHTSPPTTAGTRAVFDVTVTNNDSAACAPSRYELRTRLGDPGFDLTPSNVVPLDTGPLPPGGTAHLAITATPTPAFEGRTIVIPFDLAVPDPTAPLVFQDIVELEVAEPAGCNVSMPRELMITDLSVVEDPVRTGFADAADPRTGAFTFKRLVEDMAPTPADAPAMVEAMLASLAAEQTINGFVVSPRPGVTEQILDPWPRLPGGQLDLRAAPVRLLAVVNRFDLRNLDRGDAGEGRFVFGFVDSDGIPREATLIFEYKLPAAGEADVLAWAHGFHALGGLDFSEDYNVALQALVDGFAGRGVAPSRTNGSAISAVRTNEIAFGTDGNWELREFALSPTTGLLEPHPVDLTPDLGLNGTDALARFVNANAAAILQDLHVVPDLFEGQPFRGGASLNDGSSWAATGILDNEARHHFGVNTCNGCHGLETGTTFLHVMSRLPGFQSRLSGFLNGKTISDPITGQQRTFNDLARRRADLAGIVCPPGSFVAPTSLRRGIQRTH